MTELPIHLERWSPYLTHWPWEILMKFRYVILKRILVIAGWGNSCEIALIWMSLDFTNDQSILVRVMAWCRQATSHYLSQCWRRSLSPYGVTRSQWVKRFVSHYQTWYQSSFIKVSPKLHFNHRCPIDIDWWFWHENHIYCQWISTSSVHLTFYHFGGMHIWSLLWNAEKRHNYIRLDCFTHCNTHLYV